jgi:hypothetical protein
VSAALLLILVILRHYAWEFVPCQHQAQVWNICGAIIVLALLFGKGGAWGASGTRKFIAGWWLAEELLVIGCGSLYIYHPWHTAPCEAQCNAIFGYFDTSLIGTLLATISALLLKIHL